MAAAEVATDTDKDKDNCPKCGYHLYMYLENPHPREEPPTWPVKCLKCGAMYRVQSFHKELGRPMNGDPPLYD